jgi:hypothetical protein
MTDGLARFRELWGWDAEFSQDENHRPAPVTLFAKEMRSGRTIRMQRRDLLLATRLPFGGEPDTAVESYAAVAELTTCLSAGIELPVHVICTFTETIAAVNGLDIPGIGEKRPSLLEACDLYGVPHMDADRKRAMRDLILAKGPDGFSDDELRQAEDYNQDDTLTDLALFEKLVPTMDVPRALHRGRYLKAVAAVEHGDLARSRLPDRGSFASVAGGAVAFHSPRRRAGPL